MKSAIRQKTRLAIFASLAVAAFVSFFITSGALAGKPGGGGTSPSYTFVSAPPTDVRAFNNAGQVAARINGDPVFHQRPAIVIPEDTNGDGLPDRWYRDTNGDGVNDLLINLGVPPPYGGSDYASVALSEDINDHGQVLTLFSPPSQVPRGPTDAWCVVTPRDVNGDGKLEWFSPDANGANTLMTRLDIGPIPALSWVDAINNRGQVVGYVYAYEEFPPRSFLLDALDTDCDDVADTWFQDSDGDGANDLIVDLGKAFNSVGQLRVLNPTKVNDAGWIVGIISTETNDKGAGDPFVLIPKVDSGTGQLIWNEDLNGDGANDLVTRLPLLAQGPANVNAINSAGVMVGWSTIAGGNTRAVIWRVDAQGRITVTNLGLFGSMTHTYANGINDKLQVVGYGLQLNKSGRAVSSSCFIWENGVMKDLRLAPDQLVVSLGRQDINEAGVIWNGYTIAVPIVPAP